MTRQRYEPPQITRHDQALGNSFSALRGRRVLRAIDGVPVADLMREHGSPLFVFSEASVRERAQEMKRAFAGRYPRICFAWSYKTNHLDAICSILHQEGWYGEVVSGAEYAMARRLGVPGDKIVFNGACKPAPALRRAVDEGAFIQLDHGDELELLESLVGERAAPLPVGLRINMAIESLGATWDRFGFNLDSGEAMYTVRKITQHGRLRVAGLHCHIGTFIHLPQTYREAAHRLAALVLEVEQQTGRPIEVINLGGGLPSRSSLHTQYGQGEDTVPPLAEFAAAICDELRPVFAHRTTPPLLVIESGRALVDEAGTLLTTVVGTRRTAGERGLVMDAGVNLLYTATWYRHDVFPTEEVPGALEGTTLYGPLCMAIDVIRRTVHLPPLEPGHAVAVRPVGAYNVTQWMQFSQMRPAIVLIGEGGHVDVIRRAETIDDLKTIERLPERLRAEFPGATRLPGSGA